MAFSFFCDRLNLDGDVMCDILASPDGKVSRFTDVRIETCNLHGTGCTLSSAIATWVARQLVEEESGLSNKMLVTSIGQAKKYVTAAIREGSQRSIGKGNGPLWHFCH